MGFFMIGKDAHETHTAVVSSQNVALDCLQQHQPGQWWSASRRGL